MGLELVLIAVFVIGYLFIVFEHQIHINKAASALITAVVLWSIYAIASLDHTAVDTNLLHHLGEASGIIFFLLSAMTIVELIDIHQGFTLVTDKIKTNDKVKFLIIISVLSFFLSAILDNLTTTIVMVSLLRKIITDPKDRFYYVAMVVIAANAGGAWSPIGDVTTTMLWIKGNVTTFKLIEFIFIPSVIACAIPIFLISRKLKGNFQLPTHNQMIDETHEVGKREKKIIFFSGVGSLLFVPVFKGITHLPPYMGILLMLGMMWVISELMHKRKPQADRKRLSVLHAFQKVDIASMLFFLGILMAIGTLQVTGVLNELATFLTTTIGNDYIILTVIGMLSAIIDNVPLVAAAMGMYDLATYPVDDKFWHLLAFTAGTGGSALIIGSAAGVAAMGLEKIDFIEYLKKITGIVLVGYLAGVGTFWLLKEVIQL